jgi:hypothetical protein
MSESKQALVISTPSDGFVAVLLVPMTFCWNELCETRALAGSYSQEAFLVSITDCPTLADVERHIRVKLNDDARGQLNALLNEAHELRDKDIWSEHPKYSRASWQLEVGNNDTLAGYWDWVYSQIEQHLND